MDTKALYLYKSGDLPQAIALLRQAISELRATLPATLDTLAVQLGRVDEALPPAREAVAILRRLVELAPETHAASLARSEQKPADLEGRQAADKS